MTVSTKLMTADELLRLAGDGRRYELIEGTLIEMSPAGTEHGLIAMVRPESRIFVSDFCEGILVSVQTSRQPHMRCW